MFRANVQGVERACRVTKVERLEHLVLVLIHPFREGNGRLSRSLCALMALQAGLPFLDFSAISADRKPEYFSAVQEGLERDYSKMTSIFVEIIRNTISQV
jgi:cell filamentation protein